MNFPSLKKDTILEFYYLLLEPALEKNKLFIVTGAGLIIGSPVKSDEFSHSESDDSIDSKILGTDKAVEAIYTLAQKISDNYKEVNTLEYPLPENDGFIVLKDVTIKSVSNRDIIIPALIVFYDQIIGISIGNPA